MFLPDEGVSASFYYEPTSVVETKDMKSVTPEQFYAPNTSVPHSRERRSLKL